MRKLFRFTVSLALLALLIPGMGLAQTSSTTGALIGRVTDTSGSPLPGVTVTVSSPNLQGTRSVVTDEKGEYLLPLLPGGEYRAEYALSGVKSQVREHVVISVSRNTSVDVQMQLTATETVTVTASQIVVDPTQATTQQTFREDHLKYASIGSANRSYQSVLAQTPGVIGTGNPQVAGSNLGQNIYLVDGLNTTDPVTHTFSPNLSFDAIQEISIQTFGKDAEYGKASGGTVNVITKSGGDRFSGSLDYRYNDPDFLTEGKKTRPVTTAASLPYYGATPSQSTLRFDKSAQTNKSIQPTGALGGPILRDKLWFFISSAKPKTIVQPPNLFGFQPGQRTFTGWNTLGKLTATPIENQTLSFRYFNSHATIEHALNSSFAPDEADALQTQHSNGFALNYDAIITSKWLANLQIGHSPQTLETRPQSGDLRTPGHTDLGNSIRSVNYTNHQGRTANRNEINASTTYYLEAFGTHAFKGGINLDKTEFTSFNNAVGDPTLIPGYDPSFCSPQYGFPTGTVCTGFVQNLNGTPFRLALSPENPESTVSGKGRGFYVQDQWNPVPRLTLRLGLRHDHQTYDSGNPEKQPPSFSKLQPRLGVAYDIFNNGNSIIHGYGGTIMDENQLTLPSFGVAQPSGTAFFNVNSAGRFVYDPANSGIALTGSQYDSNLSPTYSTEYSAGFTQRVFRNTSIDITGQYRKTEDIYEDYCGNLTEGFFDECIITNQPGSESGAHDALRSDYRALITKVESRPTANSNLILSYTRAKSRGSVEYTQNAGTDFDFYPAHFVNRYGYLSDDAKDRIKVDGYYRLPWQFTLGAAFNWDSGVAYNVTQTASNTAATGVVLPYGSYFIEPRGSRRLPHFHQLDLQLQKDFNIGPVKAGLIGTVFNVLNSELPLNINGNAGSRAKTDPATGRLFVGTGTVNGSPYQQVGVNRIAATFGQYTSFQRPRRYEAGIRFEF